MRNFLMAAAVVTGLGVCTGAFAADYSNPFSTKTTAYVNFGFGGSGKQTDMFSNLHYGLRMDSVRPYAAQLNSPPRPAFLQTDFNLRDGFSGAMVNGVRFASHVKSFDEDGGETSYSMMDWGLLAVGAVALGFGIAEVVKTKDSPDPKTSTTTVQTPNGPLTVVINTVTGAVQGVLDAAGLPIDLSTVTTPVHDALCGAVAALCYSDSKSKYQSARYLQERDVQREIWLDSGNGQMGDLVRVR